MERLNLSEREPPRQNQANPQNKNRNQNFRRDPPQNRKIYNDQQIRPPFQENYVREEEGMETERLEENHVNMIGSDIKGDVFVNKEEQGFSFLEQTKNNHEDSEDYQLGF